MHDSGGVRRREPLGDLPREDQQAAHRERALAEQLPERAPFDELHGDVESRRARPTSWMVTMLGWLRADAALASRSKRWRRS